MPTLTELRSKVVVITIGTRDLMFQVRSGEWFNIGDDQMREDLWPEQQEVLSDLGIRTSTFRDITQLLWTHINDYHDRIKPVIVGKLLADYADVIERVYLVGTCQDPSIRESSKDTLFACHIVQDWLCRHYPHISSEVLLIEKDNPTHFDAMFRWWRHHWQHTVKVMQAQTLWMCLKGGVGQTAEAGRISALSYYGNQVAFFEFEASPVNRQGEPSSYTGPDSGMFYLWDRTQQQALQVLERYDYAGVKDLIKPYLDSFNKDRTKVLRVNLAMACQWNLGQFSDFAESIRIHQPQLAVHTKTWWWMAYEQAQLGMIRMQQDDLAEAFMHTFRAVEAMAVNTLVEDPQVKEHLLIEENRFPRLYNTILNNPLFSDSSIINNDFKKELMNRDTDEVQLISINIYATTMASLITRIIPVTKKSPDLKPFWEDSKEKVSARKLRNMLSHRLGGVSMSEILAGWQVSTVEQWKQRICKCLNLLSEQQFASLEVASLQPHVHKVIASEIQQLTF